MKSLLAFVALLPLSATASDCVLYLGDSFSMGAFGTTFDDELREDGFKVYSYAAGGASPYYWLSSYEPIPSSIGFWKRTPTTNQRLGYIRAVPKIEPLIDACKPDFVVVQTGVNLYATLRSKRRPKEENVAEVKSLIEGMCEAIHSRGARSFWVLPPNSHEDRYPESLQKELAEIMKSVVAQHNGGFFESLNYTRFTDPYPATDGIHYGSEESTVWAEKSVASFRAFSKVSPTLLTGNEPPRARPVEVPDLPVVSKDDKVKADRPVPYVSVKPEPPKMPEKEPVKAVEVAATAGSEKATADDKDKGKKPMASDAPPATKAADGGEKVASAADSPPGKTTMPVAKADKVGGATDKPEDTPAKEVGAGAPVEVSVDAEYTLDLKLVAKSEVKNLSEVTYSNALGVYEYEVIRCTDGGYIGTRIRVADGIVLNHKHTRAARREVGDKISMTVVPLARYPSIQRWQTVDDLRPNFEMPLFVPKLY